MDNPQIIRAKPTCPVALKMIVVFGVLVVIFFVVVVVKSHVT